MTDGGVTTTTTTGQVNTPGPNFPCPYCRARARVRSSTEVSRTLRELFYQCSNIYCGHTWKSHLSFVGTISPTALVVPDNRRLPLVKSIVGLRCETRPPDLPDG